MLLGFYVRLTAGKDAQDQGREARFRVGQASAFRRFLDRLDYQGLMTNAAVIFVRADVLLGKQRCFLQIVSSLIPRQVL